MIRDSLIFSSVNRARDPPCRTLFEVRCGSAERAAELQVLLSVDIFLFYYILQCRAYPVILW